jgi:two-component system chemotaxis response regulator CheB
MMSASQPGARPPGFQFVVVVASLGGLPVVRAVLAGLPGEFPVPVLIVLHRMRDKRPDGLAWLLQKDTSLPVRPATAELSAWGPGVTVIPGGTAATMSHHRRLRLEPVTGIDLGGDMLLASTAAAARPDPIIAVIVSGMLRDGAAGIRPVKSYGGSVLAQDPATARAPSMPASAIATGCVDFIRPPDQLAAAVTALAMAPGADSSLIAPVLRA